MDRTWMYGSRLSTSYLDGLKEFLDLAFSRASINGKILCPCLECGNVMWVTRELATEHLVCIGFMKGYTQWIAHGEPSSSSPPVHGDSNMLHNIGRLLHDRFRIPEGDNNENDRPDADMGVPDEDVPRNNGEADAFYKLLRQHQQQLYPGCTKYSTLSFIVELFHLKCLGKWSNKSFTMLLELLKKALPEGETLPKSFYETKKVMGGLGLSYEKIHACPNHCSLYWKDHANDDKCHVCHMSRWKVDESSEESSIGKQKKVPAHVMYHFPLKPRLQQLYMSEKTASHMRWHKEQRTEDGCMRHPADSPAWKVFDHTHKDFSEEARNVRLGLASDGFNPFRTLSSTHSTWPVVLIPYNLPPWLCMKQPFFMLSLLIPGPSGPGMNLDVYLQPLIEELKELWCDGAETFDASTNTTFRMRAALLWTISDFPGYAYLSGWSTKGALACPVCHKYTWSEWLKYSGKQSYMGHRCFLDEDDPLRKQKLPFDGKEDHRKPPPRLTGSSVLEELDGYENIFGKNENPDFPFNWKKRSIFFELPYWKDNLLRHNLDVMHIEKNISESVVGTLLDIDGKTKDHRKARKDLEHLGLRPELHPIPKENNRAYLPPALFSMSKKEKELFCNFIKKVKVPDNYSSNISRCVKKLKISGLKSHDHHVLMQQLLPVALRKMLPKQVRSPLIQLCKYFKDLCSKVLRSHELVRLERQIAKTLCHLERIFPPAFFDVMMHLPVHLAYEARVAGPVHYRWMYPIERYLSTLKSYVRNRCHPEGSIAEGYLADECLTFCSRYLDDIETKLDRPGRNDDNGGATGVGIPIFKDSGRPILAEKIVTFDEETLSKAHRYVLANCDEVIPYATQHHDVIRSQNLRRRRHDITRIHHMEFAKWFSNHVMELAIAGNDAHVPEEIRLLARGPHVVGKKYKGFIVNGSRFHIEAIGRKRKMQNFGVISTATTTSFSSARDNNPISGEVIYYGILKDIIELDYSSGKKVVLFKCDWVSEGRRKKQDEYGFTMVNFSQVCSHNEPFVLASQVQQVFYLEDPTENDWLVVAKTSPRDFYNLGAVDTEDVETSQSEAWRSEFLCESEEVTWIREGVEGRIVDDDERTSEAHN